MKLGLFGGTFDPIHSGHVEAAVQAADECGLDRVLVVPSGIPPHKQNASRASYEHRLKMVELACLADPRLEASRLEEPSPDGEPHYSVDTIDRIRSTMEFDGLLRVIVGADAYSEVHLWRDIDKISKLVEFVVAERPGFEPNGKVEAAHIVRCSHPASSRTIRHRVKIGGSLADLAPAKVCEYLWTNSLYLPQAVGPGLHPSE